MSAFSSKGIRIYLSKGSATPTTLTPTAISTSKPATVTVADVSALKVGDYVVVKDVGFSELDKHVYRVDNINTTGNTFDLEGSDTTNATGSLSANPVIEHYQMSDLVSLCLSEFTINNEEPGTTSVATFCDPSATLPAATQSAGTVTVGGYVDETDADYLEMIEACEDGATRVISLVLPNHGALVAKVSFGAMGFDIPIDGAPAWTATGVLATKFRHIF
jgi:hypothetical protein